MLPSCLLIHCTCFPNSAFLCTYPVYNSFTVDPGLPVKFFLGRLAISLLICPLVPPATFCRCHCDALDATPVTGSTPLRPTCKKAGKRPPPVPPCTGQLGDDAAGLLTAKQLPPGACSMRVQRAFHFGTWRTPNRRGESAPHSLRLASMADTNQPARAVRWGAFTLPNTLGSVPEESPYTPPSSGLAERCWWALIIMLR